MKTKMVKIKIWDLKDFLKAQKEVDDFNKNHQNSIFSMEIENIFKGDKGYLKSFK
jgi:hypothetical protein